MKSRKTYAVGCLLTISLLAAAPSPAQQQQAPAPSAASPGSDKPASVEGSVTNSLTGEPVPRATVSFRATGVPNPKTYGAMTDPQGKYSITAMEPGNYFASTLRVGFVSSAAEVTPRTVQLKLGAGDKRTEVNLKLIPMGTITGRVLDPDGEPLEDMEVSAILIPRTVTTTTDEKGVFKIAGLAPGKYRLRARPQPIQFPAEIRTDGSQEIHYARTYYPNAPDEATAARVEVTAGSETQGINIHPRRTALLCIRGVVRGIPSGMKGINVQLLDVSGIYVSSAQTKADGTFEVWHVDSGKYKLMASRYDGGKIVLQSPKSEVEIADSSLDNVELRLMTSADLQGRVEYDDDQAKPADDRQTQSGASGGRTPSATAAPKPQPRSIYLRSVGVYTALKTAQLGPDGTFLFTDVPPDNYAIWLAWNGAFVKSTLVGQKLSDGPMLDLQNLADGQPITIRISSATAELSGVVRDDSGPSANVRVLLTMDDPNLSFSFQTVSTDANGTYSFKVIMPGKYRVVTVRGDGEVPITGGRLAEDYREVSEVIEFTPKDKLTRDLKLRVPGSR